MDIINNNDCNNLWHTSPNQDTLAKGIAPSMMCAGVLTGGKDTCQVSISHFINQKIYRIIICMRPHFTMFCIHHSITGYRANLDHELLDRFPKRDNSSIWRVMVY